MRRRMLALAVVCVAWSGHAAKASTAALPITQETLHIIPFNYQDDTRQLETLAEFRDEFANLIPLVSNLWYGQHQLTITVWPYLTLPVNKPTSVPGCNGTLETAAMTAAHNAFPALGTPSPTNFIWFRTNVDTLDCSHQFITLGQYERLIFKPNPTALWYSNLYGIYCCSATAVFSDAARTKFVTLRDAPNPAIDLNTPWRNMLDITGQGNGAWSVPERIGVGALNYSDAVIVVPPVPAMPTTYTIMPVEEQSGGTTAKRGLEILPMGLFIEAHAADEWTQSGMWNRGLTGFARQGASHPNAMVDMPPMEPWNGGVVDWHKTGWALEVGTSYVDPTNNLRLTLVSLTNTAATVVLDHASDPAPVPSGPPPPQQCVASPNGVQAASICDAKGATWSLDANGNTLRNGVIVGAGFTGFTTGSSYIPCAGVAHVFGQGIWWAWGESNPKWIPGSATPPCGSSTPPPPLPTGATWGDFTPRFQVLSDNSKIRVCKADLSKCIEWIW